MRARRGAAGGALAAALLMAGAATAGTPVSGPARVLDARTLEVGGTVFRLAGIDAPEPGQTCGRGGRALPCGAVAKTALMDLVAGAVVVCTPVARVNRGSGPVEATCAADGFDLGANMVHTGWALAAPEDAPARYKAIEGRARARRVGLWRMSFAPPWEWRAARWPATPAE